MPREKLNRIIQGEIGSFLKTARTSRKLNLRTAAKKAGYSNFQKLEKYENGASVPCKEIVNIVDAYGIPRSASNDFLFRLQCKVWKIAGIIPDDSNQKEKDLFSESIGGSDQGNS